MKKIILFLSILLSLKANAQTTNMKFDISSMESIWCMPKFQYGQNYLINKGFKVIEISDNAKNYSFEYAFKQTITSIHVETLLEQQLYVFKIKTNNKELISQIMNSLNLHGYEAPKYKGANTGPDFIYYSKSVQFIGPKLRFIFSGNETGNYMDCNFRIEY